MTKRKTTILIIVIIFVLLITNIISFTLGKFSFAKTYQQSSELNYVNQHAPLNQENIYIIRPNQDIYTSDSNEAPKLEYPANTFLVMIPLDEINQLGLSSDIIQGHKIGKTDFDLTPYFNKPVQILGKYYHGRPLLQQSTNDRFLHEKQLVIHVQNLKLIDL